jgi:hypothetical protein
MAGENTFNDSLQGLFKKIYADNVQNLVPDHVFLAKKIPFVKQNKKSGDSYQQAVILKSEHGVTYGGSSGLAFSYNDAVAGSTQQASILPAEMVLRSIVARAALERSNTSEGAFANATKHVIENMLSSMFTKYEAQCFYGGMGLATVGSIAGNVLTVTTAEWAPALWVGGEGMKIDSYDSTSVTLHKTTEISAVDLVARKLTVADATSIVIGDVIYEKGAKGNEFIGIHKMLSTVSGNIFGLPTQTYSLWRGNQVAVGGALSFKKISDGIASAVAKGVKGKLTFLCNPSGWSNLLTEQSAQRVFHEGGMAEYSNGSESILFHSVNGEIEIVASPFVKEGYAFALDLPSFLRIGSKDISFDNPVEPGKYIKPLDSTNAYQIIGYTDSALFSSSLGKNIIFTGIVNA